MSDTLIVSSANHQHQSGSILDVSTNKRFTVTSIASMFPRKHWECVGVIRMSDELIMCVEIDEISPILCEIITGKRIQVRVNLPAEVIRKYGALIEQRRYDGLSAEEVELFAEFLPLIWRSSDGLRWSPLEVKNLYFTLEWRGALKAWWDLLNISMQLILVQMEGEQGPYQSQKLLSPGEQEPSRKIKRVNKDTK